MTQNSVKSYVEARPSSPPEAVNDMVAKCLSKLTPPTAERPAYVLDLGAGTGILTKLLVETVDLPLAITAAEPGEGMIRSFREQLPYISIVQADATNLPFPDDHFDAVFVAQAFHWFANADSLREIHRVLRPGGGLGLIWNLEDGNEPWVRKLRDIYEPYDEGVPQYWKRDWPKAFDTLGDIYTDCPPASSYWPFYKPFSKEQVTKLARSKSYISCLAEEEREKIDARIIKLLEEHSEHFEPTGIAETPYVCETAVTFKKP